jgi:hypothetical protein
MEDTGDLSLLARSYMNRCIVNGDKWEYVGCCYYRAFEICPQKSFDIYVLKHCSLLRILSN